MFMAVLLGVTPTWKHLLCPSTKEWVKTVVWPCNTTWRDFPGCPAVKTVLPLQGAQVRSLVWELRSQMPHSEAK